MFTDPIELEEFNKAGLARKYPELYNRMCEMNARDYEKPILFNEILYPILKRVGSIIKRIFFFWRKNY